MNLTGNERPVDRIQYRSDLDGLRAIAVGPVILFHMDLELVPGGFVGVDVFFVLSGFLITNMLAADLAGGMTSILNFYDRRIRRIVPALIVMLVACALAAPLILFPNELTNFGLSLSAAALSVSNVLFFFQSSYFSARAETIPLLHTWSLGVEEQFYILFPLLLWAVWRWARRSLAWLIWLLLALSLCLSVWGTSTMPAATFYLLPTRAWELLVGSALALRLVPGPGSTLQREFAALSGLVMIGGSILLITRQTPFPGLAAIPPCMGAALVIWSGIARPAQPFVVQRLLGLRPLVFVGLISYSLYLWHWPLIVFAKYLAVGALSKAVKLTLLGFIFAVAAVSWRLVEVPMRRGGRPWPTWQLRFAAAGLASTVLIAAGFVLHSGSQDYSLAAAINPVAAQAYALAGKANDFNPHRNRCHLIKPGPMPLSETCVLGAPVAPSVVVLADSHGAEFSAVLAETARSRNQSVRQITASGCPPAGNFVQASWCAEFNASILSALTQIEPTTIVVTSRYFQWATGKSADKFWNGFEATIAELRQARHAVIVIGAIPTVTDTNTPLELAKLVRSGGKAEDYRFPLDAAAPDVDAHLGRIAARRGATYVPMTSFVCPDETGCRPYQDGIVMYFDDNHLSLSGAREFARRFLIPLIWPGHYDGTSASQERDQPEHGRFHESIEGRSTKLKN